MSTGRVMVGRDRLGHAGGVWCSPTYVGGPGSGAGRPSCGHAIEVVRARDVMSSPARRTVDAMEPEPVEVGDDGIRLGQLLKLVGVVDTGGAARELLESGDVRVNGEAEPRRGRQLRPGDVVAVGARELRLR